MPQRHVLLCKVSGVFSALHLLAACFRCLLSFHNNELHRVCADICMQTGRCTELEHAFRHTACPLRSFDTCTHVAPAMAPCHCTNLLVFVMPMTHVFVEWLHGRIRTRHVLVSQWTQCTDGVPVRVAFAKLRRRHVHTWLHLAT
jgi:hypothetical protein